MNAASRIRAIPWAAAAPLLSIVITAGVLRGQEIAPAQGGTTEDNGLQVRMLAGVRLEFMGLGPGASLDMVLDDRALPAWASLQLLAQLAGGRRFRFRRIRLGLRPRNIRGHQGAIYALYEEGTGGDDTYEGIGLGVRYAAGIMEVSTEGVLGETSAGDGGFYIGLGAAFQLPLVRINLW